MVKRTGAHSTHMQSPEDVDALYSKCKPYADRWAPKADALWAQGPPVRRLRGLRKGGITRYAGIDGPQFEGAKAYPFTRFACTGIFSARASGMTPGYIPWNRMGGMETLARAMAPELGTMDAAMTAGDIQILVENGTIGEIDCVCEGALGNPEEAEPVMASIKISFTPDDGFGAPSAAISQLLEERNVEE